MICFKATSTRTIRRAGYEHTKKSKNPKSSFRPIRRPFPRYSTRFDYFSNTSIKYYFFFFHVDSSEERQRILGRYCPRSYGPQTGALRLPVGETEIIPISLRQKVQTFDIGVWKLSDKNHKNVRSAIVTRQESVQVKLGIHSLDVSDCYVNISVKYTKKILYRRFSKTHKNLFSYKWHGQRF